MVSTKRTNLPIRRDIGFNDLTLEVGEQKFEVHKIVMCSASTVMAAALTKNNFEEANTGIFKVCDFDADTVGRMIDYIYSGSYMSEEPQPAEDGGIKLKSAMEGEMLLHHTRVNVIADFYDILGLREVSREYISAILEEHWSSDRFVEFLRLCFSSGDTELHALAVASTASHSAAVSKLESFESLELPASFHAQVLRQLSENQHSALRKTKDLVAWLLPKLDTYLSSRCCSTCRAAVEVICNVEESKPAYGRCTKCKKPIAEP